MSDRLRDELLGIHDGRATGRYGLSSVNQLQHALQAATKAEANGEPASLIVAALLHDVGHMVNDLGEDPASYGGEVRHEEEGARCLA
ncbi:MAG: HD domain-containing protein, partial [Rhodospirillales bacterium]